MVYFEKGAFSHRLQVFYCIYFFHNVVNCTGKKKKKNECRLTEQDTKARKETNVAY